MWLSPISASSGGDAASRIRVAQQQGEIGSAFDLIVVVTVPPRRHETPETESGMSRLLSRRRSSLLPAPNPYGELGKNEPDSYRCQDDVASRCHSLSREISDQLSAVHLIPRFEQRSLNSVALFVNLTIGRDHRPMFGEGSRSKSGTTAHRVRQRANTSGRTGRKRLRAFAIQALSGARSVSVHKSFRRLFDNQRRSHAAPPEKPSDKSTKDEWLDGAQQAVASSNPLRLSVPWQTLHGWQVCFFA